jgi:NAD(P)-dependent dehydrogenase (short-subunit alcohol dehydrogenase family)
MDSRTLSFVDEIRSVTAGEGVHVVLNSLAGDFIAASLGLLGPGGRFLELGKRDILTPESAARLRPDVRYRAYDLGNEAQADRALLRPMFDEILAALADGSLRPLPVTIYPLDQVREAFRFMAQARHIGKIVLRPAGAAAGASTPAPILSGGATYWVTGGLGGLGLETARWLVRSGATSVVLSGRRPPTPAAIEVIRELEGLGATVRVVEADAADRARMQSILDGIRDDLPPLRGVIHAAGVVNDSVLLKQTWDRCRNVLRGKAHGSWLVHELTRHIPLDFFIMYSAAGVLLGAAGQGAYPAANAELDALAHARRRLGLPALSVAWGAWANVGMTAGLAARGQDVWAARGLGKITPALGFACLERLIRDEATYAAVLPIHWPQFLGQLSPGVDRSLFQAVAPEAPAGAATTSAPQGAVILDRLRAMPSSQRRQALVAYLTERALHVLGLDATTPVEPKAALKDVGLDSLMAVELRNALIKSLGQPLSATLLFDYPTVDALAGYLTRTFGLEPDGDREPAASTPTAETTARVEVAGLSDDEAEALLLKELDGGEPGRTHD